MSCHAHKDTLSPYTRESGTGGPTRTTTTQNTFARRLRGRLDEINTAIKTGVEENDLFRVRQNRDTLAVDDPGPFETDDSARMTVKFIAWLRKQLNNEFLGVVGPDRNQWVEKAYLAGLRNANGQIRRLNVSFVPNPAPSVVGRPIHEKALRTLFTRTYDKLENVTNDLVPAVRDELLDGFQKGQGPDKIASRLQDRIDKIGKSRATKIARSELINAHSESTLTRVDEIQEDVGGTLATTHGDWDAANDSRVCKFCAALDGVRLETSEMRGTLVTVTSPLPIPPSNPEAKPVVGQTFRLKPPAHVLGRCGIGLRVGGEITTSLEDRLPGQIQVVS